MVSPVALLLKCPWFAKYASMFSVFKARFTSETNTGDSPSFLRNQALNPFSFFGLPITYHHQTLFGLPKNILFRSGVVIRAIFLPNEDSRSLISGASFTF